MNFLGRCVVPGRAFTRRLYAYTASDKLKPYHHIRVNAEMKADLRMWLTFLQHPAVFCRPFMDFSKFLVADEIDMYSNASGKIGQRTTCRTSDAMSSKSSQSSKISLEYETNVLERLKSKQTRDTTAKNYLSIWRHLNKFIINLDTRSHHLSWEEKTALFGAYLVDGGIQSSTLKSYFSAIKHVLKQDEYPWNENKVLLSSLVRGCKLQNDQVKIRLPIQKGLLELLLFEVERLYSQTKLQPYLEHLYKAMFSLAYYGMLRVGEITESPHDIRACNIHVGNNKDKILMVLYSSKTHGSESGPQKIKISVSDTVKARKGIFCPFHLVARYMSMRGPYSEVEEKFFVYTDNRPVQAYQLRNVLRQLLDSLGLDSALYDVHSFRIGRTCDLEKFGYSVDQIKSMGRWKSNAVYRYLKN